MKHKILKSTLFLIALLLVITTVSIPVMATETNVIPNTGGIGTYIFTFIGVMIMACAIIFFINRKNKDEDDEEDPEEELEE